MITKSLSKTGKVCRVTFRVTPEDLRVMTGGEDTAASSKAPKLASVSVLGDFNGWDPAASPLARRKDGSFSATLSIDTGNHYRFRYLVDGERWCNDPQPDSHVANRYGGQDGLLEL
jgi:1,4-alpha-glucan branching enzyme